MGGKKEYGTNLEKKEGRIAFLWGLAEGVADWLKSDCRVESVWICGSLRVIHRL